VSKRRTFRFTIDGPYRPETIPMGRLAEYMAQIATILGEQANVHFVEVQDGSVTLLSAVDEEAYPKVYERVERTRRGDGPQDAMAAVRNTNKMLREDSGRGTLNDGNAEILAFPGTEEMPQIQFAAFNQEGTLDGVVIRVGGRGEMVPIHIQNGPIVYINCKAKRDVASRLAQHIFEDELRVTGTGRWSIDDTGDWVLENFRIRDFEVLDPAPLTAVVKALRAVPNNNWNQIEDPWAELVDLRDGPAETH